MLAVSPEPTRPPPRRSCESLTADFRMVVMRNPAVRLSQHAGWTGAPDRRRCSAALLGDARGAGSMGTADITRWRTRPGCGARCRIIRPGRRCSHERAGLGSVGDASARFGDDPAGCATRLRPRSGDLCGGKGALASSGHRRAGVGGHAGHASSADARGSVEHRRGMGKPQHGRPRVGMGGASCPGGGDRARRAQG
jgi:hypothetical protein